MHTATSESASALPWEPVEALGVFMDLLSEVESVTPSSSEFYDRLCEATCRLAHLSRAVIFLWDDARRQVRAVGSHDVPLDIFSETHVSTLNVPIARAALAGDCVIEAHGDFARHMPAELVDDSGVVGAGVGVHPAEQQQMLKMRHDG